MPCIATGASSLCSVGSCEEEECCFPVATNDTGVKGARSVHLGGLKVVELYGCPLCLYCGRCMSNELWSHLNYKRTRVLIVSLNAFELSGSFVPCL